MNRITQTSLRRLLAAVCAASLAASVPSARAQVAVVDAANIQATVLTAARALKEINNQLVQINQFLEMLQNEERNLTALPLSIVQQINQLMSNVVELMNQAQGIVYNVQAVEQQFQRFYPSSIGGSESDAQLESDAQTRWQYSMQTFQHTMEVQSQIVTNLPADQAQLDTLVGQSQGAVGILQAAQAGNQLVALQARQLSALQALIASQARAQAIEQARKAEAEEQAAEQFQRFIGTAPATYTPAPVSMFH